MIDGAIKKHGNGLFNRKIIESIISNQYVRYLGKNSTMNY